MQSEKFYSLPKLPYALNELAPHISEEQLKIHYEKHHQAYVSGANSLLEKMDNARKEGAELDIKSLLKELSFNIGGFLLHSLFWENLAPESKIVKEPSGEFAEILKQEFGSFGRFKTEFTKTALTVEGSGWAALVYCQKTKRPILMQIEKHNVNIYPSFKILMVLDMFEHAYYIDYKNDKAKYADAFWNIVGWGKVQERLNTN